jgi:hypothetical protein
VPLLEASFSCKASLTNSLSVWLRSAAFDLALRKRTSGISMVVLMRPYYGTPRGEQHLRCLTNGRDTAQRFPF